MELIKSNVTFGVRLDKNRGVLIETLTHQNDVFYFKHHNQPLTKHCEQVQDIVLSANVKRSKKIKIDLSRFIHEYRFVENNVWFRANKLGSERPQCGKTQRTKKIGKSIYTIAKLNEMKLQQQTVKKMKKLDELEKAFQAERARRVHELMIGRLREIPMDHDSSH